MHHHAPPPNLEARTFLFGVARATLSAPASLTNKVTTRAALKKQDLPDEGMVTNYASEEYDV